MPKTSIVFFGTGPVAAKSLSLLLKNFNVEAVVTKPKPAHHRGNFPVLDVANTNNLEVIEVTDKKSVSDAIKNNRFSSKLAVLIDFGIIITKDVIEAFEKGVVNSHFSLLPEWRGADPITFAILSGQNKTGVSLMLVDEGMDTGKILTQKTFKIRSSETTESLTNELILLSNQLLNEYLPKYLNGEIKPRQQPHPDRATYSRKLSKQDGILDFNKSAEQLEREIRAFASWPKSRTKLGDVEVVIAKAHAVSSPDTILKPGEIQKELLGEGALMIKTADGKLCIDMLKPTGKQEMSSADFLRGYASRL